MGILKADIERAAKLDKANMFTVDQWFSDGLQTRGINMLDNSRIFNLGDGRNPQDAVNKSQLDRKVDKITEEQRDSLGFMDPDDRIVSGVDSNLNEMPIKVSPNKVKNTIVMRNDSGNFQDL